MSALKSLTVAVAAASLVVAAFTGTAVLPRTAAVAGTVQFTASGDIAARSQSHAVLSQIDSLDPDLHLALGDLSYGATGAEQAWCDTVTSRVGAGFAFELIAGNHESNGLNGNINDFSACLPNQLPGLVGTYGRQYYVDVPQSSPLVRFIAISPNLTFPDGNWGYGAGSARFQWTAAAIDGARAAGIPWVVVAMHKPCISIGQYGCDVGTDITNLMLQKRVDLVLNGHEHLYQRSKQLATGAACSALVPGSYNASCVTDADDDLVKGVGTVFATVGTGGVDLRDVMTSDPEAGYFAASSGLNANPTWGNLDVSATAGQLSARFVPATGGTFADAFTIAEGAPGNTPPVAAFTPTCTGLGCTVDGTASTDADGVVTGHAWDFGDGGTATGATASHTYAAAGTYPITLTVTDDDGATATTTTAVTVTDPGGPVVLASDAFERGVVNGLGTADTGGHWTTTGSATAYSVTGGNARLRMATPGGTLNAYLDDVSQQSGDLRFSFLTDKAATGSGIFLSAIGRRVAVAGAYQAKIVLRSSGAVGISLVRVNASGGGEVTLAPAINVPGLTYAAGDRLNLRLQAIGTSPTTLNLKVWKAGAAEPSAWQRTATDSTAGLQAPGSIGMRAYLSSSSTNAPVVASIDDLLLTVP
ncbi:PKD domain-containing protein [Agromyces sp. NPDC058484]|uniref:PKD domain-containing protein n=1 Tax=Agromyces sp. NPDC058484 TaxID=3346524 RepID=UPI0036588461